MSAEAALEIEHVSVRLGGIQAVDDVSLSVDNGTLTSLIGPNGAGKTTLFHAVSGFLRPSAGRVRFRGSDITGLAPHAVARRGMVRTFQQTHLLRRMTVLENVLVGCRDGPGNALWHNFVRRPGVRRREQAAKAEAQRLLDMVGLSGKARELAGTLSTGQGRLLEFARALMAGPAMLLLDEPLAGVNPSTALVLMERIDDIRRARGLTVLLVEHKLDVVMSVSDNVVVMAGGRVVAAGTPEQIVGDERVIDAYLGTRFSAQPGEERP